MPSMDWTRKGERRATPDRPLPLADAVLRLIWRQQRISRAEIARMAGLSRSTVSEIVTEILPTGLVAEIGAGPSRGGRRPIVLEFRNDAYVVLGVDTPIGFLRDILAHDAFAAGDTQTDFIPKHFPDWQASRTMGKEAIAVAALAARLGPAVSAGAVSGEAVGPPTPWQTLGAWTVES